jgi:hypothetical protein
MAEIMQRVEEETNTGRASAMKPEKRVDHLKKPKRF